MARIQQLHMTAQPHTGPVQFASGQRGIFIREHDAEAMAFILKIIRDKLAPLALTDPIVVTYAEDLVELLEALKE